MRTMDELLAETKELHSDEEVEEWRKTITPEERTMIQDHWLKVSAEVIEAFAALTTVMEAVTNVVKEFTPRVQALCEQEAALEANVRCRQEEMGIVKPIEPAEWRVTSWDWGQNEDPFILAEFGDGKEIRVELIKVFPEYEYEFLEEISELPRAWSIMITECVEECTEVFGEDMGDGWHWKSGESPCRWRPVAEFDALFVRTQDDPLNEEET